MVEPIDLDAVEAVINRPHVIDIRADGWTIMHPPTCHPDLFACPVSQVATKDLQDAPRPAKVGRFYCDLRPGIGLIGRLRMLGRAHDAAGVDWAALVAELRAAREVVRCAWDVGSEQLDDTDVMDHLTDALEAHATAAWAAGGDGDG